MKNYGLTTGLMIASFIFMLCFFFFFVCCFVIWEGTVNVIWLWCVIISFLGSIPAMYVIVTCKRKLNILMDYGEPVRIAAEYIKKIIGKLNIYGVESVQSIVEKAMKDELLKIAKKEKK